LSGLTRRAFLATTAALSGAWALPSEFLGSALAAPTKPSTAPSTLQKTIRQKITPQKGKFRLLADAPGEPHQVRSDLMKTGPDPKRQARRRSLLYAGHFSDVHLIDAQSPARLEPLEAVAPDTMADASRPHDTLTTNVLSEMVKSVADLRFSQVTGAPMSTTLVTGDAADSHASTELRWFVNLLDGTTMKPNSGGPKYEGVQVWPEATYVWQPENPDGTVFGDYGYPRIPGLLDAAVSQEVTSPGLPVPWYSVYGNHDTTFMGNLKVDSWIQQWAVSDRKCSTAQASVSNMMLDGWVSESSALQRLVNNVNVRLGLHSGVHAVTPDPERKLFDQQGFIRIHMDTKPVPGPIGHGFTQQNLDTGETWWKADVSPHFRVFGLDTCNQVVGADGAVPENQFNWLRTELATAKSEQKLCIVMSHHNSYTLENPAQPAFGGQRLIHAEEFVAMLHEFPNMVAWVNGHTHINTITAHRNPSGHGGFWEITTASCIDFPQQQQVVEFVDNRDGTMSIFTTVLDHNSPPTWTPGDFSQQGLASLSRELAANYWFINPLGHLGSVLDRNCELLMPAPFDLSSIDDAGLELTHASQKARLLAWERGLNR